MLDDLAVWLPPCPARAGGHGAGDVITVDVMFPNRSSDRGANLTYPNIGLTSRDKMLHLPKVLAMDT